MNLQFLPKLLALGLLSVSLQVAAQQNDGISSIFGDSPPLLSPEEAFQGQLSVQGEDLLLSYEIAEGYYLYRDKFVISPKNESLQLAVPEWPKADVYEDAYFGESAIYRFGLNAIIPIKASQDTSAIIEVTYQGCADIGVCFPPTTASFSVNNLPQASGKTAGSLLAEIKSYSNKGAGAAAFGGNNSSLLAPTEAYQPFVEATSEGINVVWSIEPGYYLYQDKLRYEIAHDSGESQAISRTQQDAAIPYNDEFFGETSIYRNTATDQIILPKDANGSGQLTLHYQGCADIGVCFPPDQFTLPVTWRVVGATDNENTQPTSTPAAENTANSATNELGLSEQDRLAAQLANTSLWKNAALFFIFGLALAFTPCVLPMVPILSSIIVGGGKEQSTAQAFGLSVVYVLGMALTYTAVGVLVGLSGYNIQAWFQNPWILSAFAALFVVLSLAMFGVFELQLPSSLQSKLTSISNKQSGGRVGGVFIMGFLSALIVGPCVTAPLMGALIYIADTGNAVVGGVALFALSIGMGTPLLLIGTSAGRWVPQAGGWMNAIKIVFGFMMLAMAIWMLSRFLDAQSIVLLSAALAVCGGVWFLLEFTPAKHGMGLRTVGVAAGICSALYGLALLVGTLAGTPSLVKPLGGLNTAANYSSAAGTTASAHLNFQRIKSVDDVTRTVNAARQAGKAVMLDFYADWCVSCKEMEAFTFTDAAVQAKLANVELIQADVTLNDKTDQALLKHFGLFGPPAIIFYDPNGDEIRNARLVGFLNATQFSSHLSKALPLDATH